MIQASSQPAPPLEFAQSACTQSWTPVWESGKGAIQPVDGGWMMAGKSVLGMSVCSPGTLRLAADKEGPGNPVTSVTLDGDLLADLEVDSPQDFTVEVPHAGQLQIGYHNDFYGSAVRLVSLRQFRMDMGACRRLTDITVPPENGGGYVAASEILTLVGNAPATVKPCAAGKLSFALEGQKVDGAYPTIRITQAGKTLLETQGTETRTQHSLEVSAAPLQVTLLNPYSVELQDRNLLLRSLNFRTSEGTSIN